MTALQAAKPPDFAFERLRLLLEVVVSPDAAQPPPDGALRARRIRLRDFNHPPRDSRRYYPIASDAARWRSGVNMGDGARGVLPPRLSEWSSPGALRNLVPADWISDQPVPSRKIRGFARKSTVASAAGGVATP